MMNKIIILMIVLFTTINISYADTDSFHWSGSDTIQSNTWTLSGSYTATHTNDNSLYFIDQQTLESFQSVVEDGATGLSIIGGDGNTGVDNSVTFMYGAQVVGTGIYGYMKMPDGKYKIYVYHWQDWDVSGISTPARITIETTTIKFKNINNYAVMSNSPYTSGTAVIEYKSNYMYSHLPLGYTGRFNTSVGYDYYNRYSYLSYPNYNYLHIDRVDANKSKTIIEINGIEVKNETTLTLTNIEWTDSFNIWNITMENQYGDIDTKTLNFAVDIQTSATITNNQTSYTNPEIILSNIILNEPDYNNYYYRVKVMYEKYSNSYDYAVVSYNQSQIISTDESYYEIDINEDYYDLPTKFKVIVESYNKNTGVSVIIGESNIFMYNPTQYYDNIIDGYILDTTTNAYVSNVHIYYNNSLESYYDLTDSNGYFKFYLPTDLYNVHIEKNNYHDTDFSQYIDYSELTKIYITPLDEDINLYGNVLNLNTNLPLSDVKITVNNETYTQFTYSNNYGYYEFYNIQNNTNYTLIAELDNYYSFNELIVIPSDAPKYQLINLIPIIDDIDTDIDQQIEDLKEEIQPIKDLIFGLSEIVIDNPDYNNDNIISENEYASFINSLVPLVIIIFIVIMYIGLKDRREKK